MDPTTLLLPPPRDVTTGDDWVKLSPASVLEAGPEVGQVTLDLVRQALARLESNGKSAPVRLEIAAELGPNQEAYELQVNGEGALLRSPSPEGLFRAASTLAQWISVQATDPPHENQGNVRRVDIRDVPDFPHRGVMLDVSRNKVPTLDTLKELIDLLASWKINQLQLYTEHTFAYKDHETVWADASPLTAEDIRELDAYSRERFMELVPNQNSFGHFHRWLRHPEYRDLAECPEGIDHPFSRDKEPFSLCPIDARCIDLLDGLYAELLPCFESDSLNVGLDETIDLGLGRSKEACEERGKETVYLEFLRSVHELARKHGKRMMLWGDIVLEHPQLIPELPSDIIALQWGYEAGHPFAQKCEAFAAAGLEHWVCPGTSSWHAFGGRTQNAIGNLANAAVNGHEHGARGYLNCDWGDCGHLQPLPVSYLGFAAGAAFSWRVDAAREPEKLDVKRLLDLHAFEDSAGVMGDVAAELGECYRMVGQPPMNGSALFFIVAFTLLEREPRLVGNLTIELLDAERDRIEGLRAQLAEARPGRDGERVLTELDWTARMLSFACRFGAARLASGDMESLERLSAEDRSSFADELEALTEERRSAWLARNREGGLDEATSWLARVTELLRS